MSYIEIKKKKGRNYAYYVTFDDSGKRNYNYIGAITNIKDNTGAVCGRCGKRFNDNTIRQIIGERLRERIDEMEQNKEHISNYAQYSIIEELLKVFMPES